MALIAIKFLLAYLLGSLSGSLVVGRIKGGVDIRRLGSGNAGATNALRTQGKWFALWVMVIDIGKGWLAVALLARIGVASSDEMQLWTECGCAFAVVLGHVYPVWFGFRGGKGAATLVGVVLALAPAALAWVLSVWLLVLLLTGFVGLSTMLATLGFVVWAWLTHAAPPLLYFGVGMMLFVTYTHRANIARMRAGNEHRTQRLWLFKPRA